MIQPFSAFNCLLNATCMQCKYAYFSKLQIVIDAFAHVFNDKIAASFAVSLLAV